MAHSSSPFSPWPGARKPVPVPDPPPDAAHPPESSRPDAVLHALREKIAAGKEDTDVLLGAIAIAAQAMTDASGAALGLRRDGVVVCVGRSGETAPALGARLSEESGISGECLRTGRLLSCPDTLRDMRVDPEVCLQLGIRSIIAVPLRSRLETIGILEAFATTPDAFNKQDEVFLAGLAELADVAHSKAAHAPRSLVDQLVPVTEPPAAPFAAPELPWPPEEPAQKSNAVYWRLAALALLLLVSYTGWRLWSRDRASVSSVAPVTQAQPVTKPAEKPSASTVPAVQNTAPEPAPQPARSLRNSSTENSAGVVPASQLDFKEVVVRDLSGSEQSQPAPANGNAATVVEAPEVQLSRSAEPKGIIDLVAAPVVVPTLGPRVSQGVRAATILRRVEPSYPREALSLRIQGPVVMSATIGTDGRMKNVRAIKGHPVLARAATDAVKQWRYKPAMLNGEVVKVDTEITVVFKLP
jgi:periplasmic protein TonB